MGGWIKISGDTFWPIECDVQLSFEKWAIIYISFDISKHPSYYDDLLDIYESGKVFSVCTAKLAASRCRIKTMDIDFGKKVSITVRCESIDTLSDRREQMIDDLLKGKGTTFVRLPV